MQVSLVIFLCSLSDQHCLSYIFPGDFALVPKLIEQISGQQYKMGSQLEFQESYESLFQYISCTNCGHKMSIPSQLVANINGNDIHGINDVMGIKWWDLFGML